MNVVVRFRSLGDVVLTAAFTRALAPVTYVTHARYAPLVARFPGVVDVRTPDTLRANPLPATARVVDLQHNLRSLRLRADARVDRATLARVLRPALKRAPAPSVLTRYAAACGVTPAPLPWLAPVPRGDALLLVPGAAHATKRWHGFAALGRAWAGPVRVLGGPGEEALVAEIAGACGGEAICETGYDRTLGAMRGAAVLVAGDTGLLHLGAAVGLPVVALFGPTHPDDGFFAYADPKHHRALGLPLDCRPCSRHGSDHCPVGDHACMRDLHVEMVLDAARGLASA
jgi:ADP-heptose:LPS heptosyltransferase